MKPLLLIALGGGIGAVTRYKLGGWVVHLAPGWRFPIGTFTINVLGSLVAGILAGLIEKHGLFSEDTRLFLFAGVLGGFTTFSAFGMDTVTLYRRGEMGIAAGYAVLSVLCGIAVLALGFSAVRWVSR